jgi:hypothetical protein
MGLNNAPTFRANGTIGPSKFVKIDTTADGMCLQATAGDPIIGISQVGMRRTPGLAGSDIAIAALAGEVIQVWGLGDVCPLTFGGTVTRGDLLMSDANGNGITATGTNECGARALQSGVSGGTGLVQIVSRPAS